MAGLLGTTPPERKQLSLILRLSATMCLEHDLKLVKSLNLHTSMTANVACSQLARAAGKHADRFSMSSELIRHVAERVRSIKMHVRMLRKNHDAIFVQNRLIVDTKIEDSTGVQFSPLFGRLRRDTSLEHLIGKSRIPPIVRPVELTLVSDSVKTFHDVATALRRCVHLCTLDPTD
jgi:hypothetical protein